MPDDRDEDATKAAAKRDAAGQHHLLYKYQRKENKNANSNGSSGGSHNNNHNGGDSNSTSDPALPSSPQETNPTMDSSQEEEDNSMRSNSSDDTSSHLILDNKTHLPPTRLLVRRHSLRYHEEGLSGTHIYAIRYPHDQPLLPRGNGEGKESGSSGSPVLSQEQAQPRHVKKRWIRDKPYTLPSPTGEPINVDHLFRPSTMAAKPKQQGKLICDLCDIDILETSFVNSLTELLYV